MPNFLYGNDCSTKDIITDKLALYMCNTIVWIKNGRQMCVYRIRRFKNICIQRNEDTHLFETKTSICNPEKIE